MNRILIFGDSQVATIATAFKRLDMSKSGTCFNFVSAPGPVARKLRTDGHRLHLEPIPDTWSHAYLSDEHIAKWYEGTQAQISFIGQGSSSIDLTDFDALICTGGHILARWNTLHDAVATPYLSAACIEQVCLDVLKGMPHGQWLKGLMNSPHRGSVDVLSLPEPLLNEMSPLVETPAYAGKRFREVEKVIVNALPQFGSTFIPVPDELISNSGNSSPAKYKVDRQDDFVHLNHEGGDIILRSLIDALDRLRHPVGRPAVASTIA
jgi:hypothetical protein